MTRKLARVPLLMPDGTLSSAILRLAKVHSASPHEICQMLWPGVQIWTRDIDRSASDALLAAVSARMGLSFERVEELTLRGLVRSMGFDLSPNGLQRGILPVGIYHRIRRRFGQQYCPICIAAEPRYTRRTWRLEFSVACLSHGVLLQDSCLSCGAAFIPHRRYSLLQAECHQCGQSLVKGAPQALDGTAANFLQNQLMIQIGFDRKLNQAPWQQTTEPPLAINGATPHAFVDGVHRLCRVAARSLDNLPPRTVAYWPLLRAPERLMVMEKVGQWVVDWPHGWIDWATNQGLTQNDLDKEYGPWPTWVSQAHAHLPIAHGPIGMRRRRSRMSLSALRRRSHSTAMYRKERERLLLRRARLMSDVCP